MLRLGGELFFGKNLGKARDRGGESPGACEKPKGLWRLLLLIGTFMGWSLTSPAIQGRCLFFSALSKALLMPQVLSSEQ